MGWACRSARFWLRTASGPGGPLHWVACGGIRAVFRHQHTLDGARVFEANVFVNNDLVAKGSVRAPEDLLDPRWRGKISWLDPRASGAGASVLTYFLFVLGEERLKTDRRT